MLLLLLLLMLLLLLLMLLLLLLLLLKMIVLLLQRSVRSLPPRLLLYLTENVLHHCGGVERHPPAVTDAGQNSCIYSFMAGAVNPIAPQHNILIRR